MPTYTDPTNPYDSMTGPRSRTRYDVNAPASPSGTGSPSSGTGSSSENQGYASKPHAVIEGAADGLADGLEREDIQGEVHGAISQVERTLDDHPSPRSERLRARLERLDDKVETLIDKTKVRARAVAETARRAKNAPPKVADDLKVAARSWSRGFAQNVGFVAAAGFVGLVALVVLTVGMVQGLNDAWG